MARDAEKLAGQAERIKQLRALARVSQLKAANAVGVTPRAYQAWEAGDSDISGENLGRLARYFGTTPDYIEYGVTKRETPDAMGALGTGVEARLAAIEEEIRLLRMETLARAAAILRRLDEALPPNEAPQLRRPA